MSRYIDADAFYERLHQNLPYDPFDMLEELRKCPPAIVQCDRCMEWHPRESTNYGFCIRWGQYTKECDYCSYGK